MEKVCGYKALDGTIHEKLKDCEQANIRYKMRLIENELQGVYSVVEKYLQNYFREPNFNNLSERYDYFYMRNLILEIISKGVLRDSEEFLKIIEKKEELSNRLDELRKAIISNRPWYLRFKWW